MAPPRHPADPPGSTEPRADAVTTDYLRALLEGVQALRAARPEEAVACLRRARDSCVAAGKTADAVDTEILLATVGAEVASRRGTSREPVLTLLDGASRRAEQAGLPAQAAKACLVLGCFARLSKEPELAGKAFMRAAGFAEQARLPLLGFHALRMAGELALEAGLRARTQSLWREALAIVASVPTLEATATGLGESAEQLTEAFKQQGFTLPARSADAAAAEEAAS